LRVRVGIVGGLGRCEAHYGRLAADVGHEALFHDGVIRGRAARTLEHLIDRCEVIVIVTDVNSHAAVQLARRRLRVQGRTPLLLRRIGLARFAMLLAALSVRRSSCPVRGAS
jgi:hypothetical protein